MQNNRIASRCKHLRTPMERNTFLKSSRKFNYEKKISDYLQQIQVKMFSKWPLLTPYTSQQGSENRVHCGRN